MAMVPHVSEEFKQTSFKENKKTKMYCKTRKVHKYPKQTERDFKTRKCMNIPNSLRKIVL